MKLCERWEIFLVWLEKKRCQNKLFTVRITWSWTSSDLSVYVPYTVKKRFAKFRYGQRWRAPNDVGIRKFLLPRRLVLRHRCQHRNLAHSDMAFFYSVPVFRYRWKSPTCRSPMPELGTFILLLSTQLVEFSIGHVGKTLGKLRFSCQIWGNSDIDVGICHKSPTRLSESGSCVVWSFVICFSCMTLTMTFWAIGKGSSLTSSFLNSWQVFKHY
jgi:hypothetical protein